MRTSITTMAVTAGAALVLVPATVFAGPPAGKGPDKPAKGATGMTGATGTTGTTGTTGPKGNAYGKRCQGVSKKHVKGQKGTPFSQCVKAMKAMDTGKTTSPRKACKALKAMDKVKVDGKKGTSYKMCVKAAAKVKAAS